jgi:4'-phosphopantetheinyl transferase
MIAAPGDDVHLWLVFEAELDRGPPLDAQYRSLLTDEERAKEARFYFARDRRRYLVTRALIRTLLSGYAGDVDPRDWRFATNEYGRPHVATPDALGALSFNLAHTAGLIVCACTSAGAIGVDAEHVQRDKSHVEIADRYFSAAEVSELQASPPEQRAERFFYYWTLKESYIKAIGTGLSTPLDRFSFNLARSGSIGLSFHEGLDDDPRRWRFWLLEPVQTHLVAVCAERAQRIVARKVVPLVGEQDCEYRLLAQSSG